MRKDVEEYFEEMEEACGRGDTEAIAELGEKIMKSMLSESLGEEGSEERDKEFVGSIEGKSIHKYIKKIIDGKEISDLSMVKVLSSLITHIAIECEVKGRSMREYPVKKIMWLLEGEIKLGRLDKGEAIDFIRERYGRFI